MSFDSDDLGSGLMLSLRILMAFGILTLAELPAAAQSTTEARFVLKDIQSWLPGTYDSEPQIFLEKAFGASNDGPHDRMFVAIREAGASTNETVVVTTEWRSGDKHAPVTRRERWSFAVSEAARAVIMRRHNLGTDDDLTAESQTSGTQLPCSLVWLQGQSNLFAKAVGADCSGPGHELLLDQDGLWILNLGADEHPLVRSRHDGIHTKLYRTNMMECFVNVLHEGQPYNAGLEGRTLINPIQMHDRGDTYSFETNEEKPRKFILMLRKAMWPSRSGRNFAPMLMLWLYRDKISPESLEGSAWAAADSTRVAFDARGVGARCKSIN